MLVPCLYATLAHAAEVRIDGRRYTQLVPVQEPAADGPFAPLLQPGRAFVDTTRASWTTEVTTPVLAATPGFLIARVALADATLDRVTLDGKEVPVHRIGEHWVAAMAVEGPATLRVRSFVPSRANTVFVPGGGAVTVRGPVFVDGAPRVAAQTWWTLTETANLVVGKAPRAAEGNVVMGETAVGLTVRDASLAARARLRFRVARGQVDTVAFDLESAPPDLELRSDQVARVDVEGARATLVLARPERSLVDVEATWTIELPPRSDARIEVPLPVLQDTFRDTTVLQVARDTDREVLPAAGSLVAALGSSLPDWGRGLIDGTLTASFVGGELPAAELALLKTSIVDQPPTVIEVAEATIATSAEGRLLMRSRLAVRNDRAAFLAVDVPEGLRMISARVKGETALVSPLGGDRYLVPLARSVQSIQGSLSFPVELGFLGSTDAWPDRGTVTLPLPSYDAPVAVHRTTLHLPSGYLATSRRQDSSVVGAFTEGEGINYGFEPSDERVAQADALLDRAVTAWLANDFETTEGYLEGLDAIGADNADVGRLRSNLSVVLDGAKAKKAKTPETAATRRLKALARARSEDDLIVQREKIDEAEDYIAQGDYTKAQRSYETALEIGNRLERIAADEDVSQQVQNEDLRQKLEALPQDVPEPVSPSTGEDVLVKDDRRPRRHEKASESAEPEAPAAPREPDEALSRVIRDPSATADPDTTVLDVRSTTASVLVPTQGEAVRHQRLLIAAGDEQSIAVRVRNPRRNR